jgi:hypothetical protein
MCRKAKFPANCRNSLQIPHISGNLDAETGSILTASATTQSCAKRDFLVFAKYPRFCAGAQAGFRSLQEEGPLRGSLGPSVSGGRKPFPGARARTGKRLGSHATETGFHARVSSGLGHDVVMQGSTVLERHRVVLEEMAQA